jgi:photosystem II stability/assembly factor-like uncharacterized protein
MTWMLGLVCLLLAGSPPLAAGQTDETAAARWQTLQNDALLRDVTFVDPQHGWAVGDRGVIWHTANGGQTWRLQPSGVAGSLHSVVFLDPQNGWAAGGESRPYTHTSRGVVLQTSDGGKQWRRLDGVYLPRIEELKFFNARQGVAIGQASDLFPCGVFITEDGGRSFRPASPSAPRSWLTGDFVDLFAGSLAGRDGALSDVRRRDITNLVSPGGSLRAIADLRLVAPTGGWLVGDGGLVLQTADLGKSWQTPRGDLPRVAEQFDFRAVEVVGSHVWIAGAPGGRVFHSPDGGGAWEPQSTGVSIPIESLAFTDAQHGWAVGSLGVILATDDGGATWRRQRAGGLRSALLAVYSQPMSIPLEVLAQFSSADGYLAAASVVHRPPPSRDNVASHDSAQRTHDAVVQLGGGAAETAWRFPLPESELGLSAERLVEVLAQSDDGRGLEHLDAYLVRQIRQWRPDVLFTHDVALPGDHPLAQFLGERVLRAVESAADPTQYVLLATEAGLAPWRVSKVYGTRPPGERGPVVLDASDTPPALGRSLADEAALARGLIAVRRTVRPAVIGAARMLDQVPEGRGEGGFFAGVAVSPGSDARRTLIPLDRDNLDQLRRIAQRRRNMEHILQQDASDPAWAAETSELIRDLDNNGAAEVLHQMASQYAESGRLELAARTFETLASRQGGHPLSESAALWLLQYYASGEAAHWVQMASRAVIAPGPSGGVQLAGGTAGAAGLNATVLTQSAPVDRVLERDRRRERAIQIARYLETSNPELHAAMPARFPLAVAQRGLGYDKSAEQVYLDVRGKRADDAWWSAAHAERWLKEPSGAPPMPIWTARRAESRPLLDGRPDDPCWLAAREITLVDGSRPSGDAPARRGQREPVAVEARISYDDEFLYLAVVCRKSPRVAYPASTGAPRPRDADLTSRDRVELSLDVDRDYTTYWRLSIDHRGWTAESCLGGSAWNPTWYVAASETDELWMVEAAIPLAELTETASLQGAVWAAGLVRVAPGDGAQRWSSRDSSGAASFGDSPAKFGLLLFQ